MKKFNFTFMLVVGFMFAFTAIGQTEFKEADDGSGGGGGDEVECEAGGPGSVSCSISKEAGGNIDSPIGGVVPILV